MTTSVETELRAALAALTLATESLPMAAEVPVRETIHREIATARTSIGRALHLLAGVPQCST